MTTRAADFTAIPEIDISALFGSDTADHVRVADDLRVAAADVGFLYVSGAPVPQTTFDRMLAASQEFFALPLAEKMRVYIGNSTNHRGYVPEGEEVFDPVDETDPHVDHKHVDHKEAFDLALELSATDPDYLGGNPMLGPNQWPRLPGFAEAVYSYYRAMQHVGHTLMRGFALALGLPTGHFDPVLTKPPSQLRLIHYPHNLTAADRPGIGAHTDYECFTLLRSTAPGLEVRNGRGEWIDAPPRDDTYVCNIGDMLELWTNGYFRSTTHRVRPVAQERYSFPMFFSVDYSTVVSPLARFATPGQPARGSVRAGAHLATQTAATFRYLQRNRTLGRPVE